VAWLEQIDPDNMKGLEIGALDKPHFDRTRTQVRYVDHATTDELRAKYADDEAMADRLDVIVEVDFVWGDKPLLEVVGDDAPYDFVFASHVVEHVPDLIGWLREIHDVLRPGGVLALAVPDKRFCFDANRALTTVADVVDAHLRGLRAPGFRQIYDFHANIVPVDPAAIWAGQPVDPDLVRVDLEPDEWAYELCQRHASTGAYVDGHCQVFTPASFVDVFAKLTRLDLTPLRIADFHPTVAPSIEFQVTLERAGVTEDAGARKAHAEAGLEKARRVLAGADEPVTSTADSSTVVGPGPDGAISMVVSPKERDLILRKRRAVEGARGLLRPGRSR
jgi:hypothetical protein